jgi:predicted transcriptional regulator
MVQRRPSGELESEVLSVLWSEGHPLTPGEVQDQLGGQLAYTTVMTVLTRLWEKGIVTREQNGRSYAYSPVISESDLSSERLGAILDSAADRRGALAGFVGRLGKRDISELRKILDGLDGDKA